MALEEDRQPAIEQNCTFFAKTKDGQNVEFDAILRIYITPPEDVTLSDSDTLPQNYDESTQNEPYMEGEQNEREPTMKQNSNFVAKSKDGQDIEFDTSLKVFIPPEDDYESFPDGLEARNADIDLEPTPGSALDPDPRKARPTYPGNKLPGDESDVSGRDRSGKSRSECDDRDASKRPSARDCSNIQFVPDPCEAIYKLERSVSGFLSNMFSLSGGESTTKA